MTHNNKQFFKSETKIQDTRNNQNHEISFVVVVHSLF